MVLDTIVALWYYSLRKGVSNMEDTSIKVSAEMMKLIEKAKMEKEKTIRVTLTTKAFIESLLKEALEGRR
jgi:hypothetical protein